MKLEDSKYNSLMKEDIFGDNRLEIFKRYGTKAAITDYAILLGGYASICAYVGSGNKLEDRTSWWWTGSFFSDYERWVVYENGVCYSFDIFRTDGGFRPFVRYSSIKDKAKLVAVYSSVCAESMYREYPQMVASSDASLELERVYNEGSLSYSTYQECFSDEVKSCVMYNGRKYIRFIADIDGGILSNGRRVEKGCSYWVSVQPIIWLIDMLNDVAIPKKILFVMDSDRVKRVDNISYRKVKKITL